MYGVYKSSPEFRSMMAHFSMIIKSWFRTPFVVCNSLLVRVEAGMEVKGMTLTVELFVMFAEFYQTAKLMFYKHLLTDR